MTEDCDFSPLVTHVGHRVLLTALRLDAEAVFEAFVRVGAGDDLWVGAAHVHVPLALDDVAAIALQALDCRGHTRTTC